MSIGVNNSSLVANIYVGDDGKLHKVQGGADSVLPFSGGLESFNLVYEGGWIDGTSKTYNYTPSKTGNFFMNVVCGGGSSGASATLSGTYEIIDKKLSINEINRNTLSYLYILKLTEGNAINITTKAVGNSHCFNVMIFEL